MGGLRLRHHAACDHEGSDQRSQLQLLRHPVRQTVLHGGQLVDQVGAHGGGQFGSDDQPCDLGDDVAQGVSEFCVGLGEVMWERAIL